jgi:hypothetical protein
MLMMSSGENSSPKNGMNHSVAALTYLEQNANTMLAAAIAVKNLRINFIIFIACKSSKKRMICVHR